MTNIDDHRELIPDDQIFQASKTALAQISENSNPEKFNKKEDQRNVDTNKNSREGNDTPQDFSTPQLWYHEAGDSKLDLPKDRKKRNKVPGKHRNGFETPSKKSSNEVTHFATEILDQLGCSQESFHHQ